MDPIPENGNANDPLIHSDLNQFQNLSLKDHNQKLFLEAEEFKNRFKDSVWSKFGGDGMLLESLTGPCLCGGPRNHPDRSVNAWTFPNQKLYSAAEGPTHKSWSPLAPPSP